MAEIKDKVITVESLKALHDYNKENYMAMENPVGTGSLSMNEYPDSIVGINSVALGELCVASGNYSHAVGWLTKALGEASHSEGCGSYSIGDYSHTEGHDTIAGSNFSHAEGYDAWAYGESSHVEGYGTRASSNSQHVQGKFNIEDNEDVYAHIVGNGTSDAERSNAHTLDWDGNAWYAGDITAEGNMILTASQYGDELPAAGTKGRIFFKKLSE